MSVMMCSSVIFIAFVVTLNVKSLNAIIKHRSNMHTCLLNKCLLFKRQTSMSIPLVAVAIVVVVVVVVVIPFFYQKMPDKDLSSIRLPLSWKPNSDLMSKLLFNDPMIVNLVVQSLLDIPADSYKIAPNKWADGTRSDVVYSIRDESTVETSPILIEFQSKFLAISWADLFGIHSLEKPDIMSIQL
ncbi:MAG: hypothetical protein EXX96DRAFT_552133 [Benjaminiella poitrasii]|nr:MAG: hypothetical protein EXX96DRAFT_552133 [Benjaminiella poitrasii]